MNNRLSIAESLQWARDYIINNANFHIVDVSSVRLDTEVLLAHVLKKDRSYLYAWPEQQLSEQGLHDFQLLINERRDGKPIAYITGVQEFWSLLLKVNEATLIPRPETEQMVSHILQAHADINNLRLLDAGTGSGAIALALASEKPFWNIVASDNSVEALSVAKDNAKKQNLSVSFFQNNWLSAITPESYDVIVSNPPYISVGDQHLSALRYEPQTALVALDDGLADIKIIVQQAIIVLKHGGALYIEHGYQQGDAVQQIFWDSGFKHVACEKDYGGNDRFTYGIKNLENNHE